MKKLLVMVPSRGRPKRLEEFVSSMHKTGATPDNGVDLIVYLNEDDPKRYEYGNYEKTIWGKRLYLAEAYNYLFQKYPDYAYYSLLNDDHYCITPSWNKELIKRIEEKGGWGLSCGEDHLTDWNKFQHPSGMIISGNIPRALGYMIWPKIQHIGIDCFFKELLTPLNLMYHTMDVVIEHRHWINGKALLDENYKWVYNKDQYQYGMGMVQEYIRTQLNKDIEKIKQAMKGE
jgi:hypothetical protein